MLAIKGHSNPPSIRYGRFPGLLAGQAAKAGAIANRTAQVLQIVEKQNQSFSRSVILVFRIHMVSSNSERRFKQKVLAYDAYCEPVGT